MEKYSSGNIIEYYDTIRRYMGIDRIPECPRCPEKPQRPQNCPKEPLQCPLMIVDWVTKHFADEELLVHGMSPVEAGERIYRNRLPIQAAFEERGCTIYDRLLQRRLEIAFSYGVQKSIRREDRLRAASRTARSIRY